jgi:hypothetical protein
MYILVIWTVISIAGTSYAVHEKMGWKPIGEFSSEQSCQAGGLMLNIKPESIRCLKK